MNQPLTAEQANQELITQVLTQILAEKPTLLPASATCQCHWIDPNKLRILLWKDQDTYILKVAEQKFVGVARSDRRGEVYWKFRELYESQEAKSADTQPKEAKPTIQPEIEVNRPLSSYSKAEIDRLAKFQERQAKAQPKEPKSMSSEEYLTKLAQERVQREAQLVPENIQKQEASN